MKTKREKILWAAIGIFFIIISLLSTLFILLFQSFGEFSLLPVLLVAAALLAFISTVSFCLWVFYDSEKRGENGLLWSLVMLLASPFLGIIIYLLCRKSEKTACKQCGYTVSLSSNYCEYCGTALDKQENIKEFNASNKNKGLKYIIVGIISAFLMIGCFGTLIVYSFASSIDAESYSVIESTSLNKGIIYMKSNLKMGNNWKLSFNHASMGYRANEKFSIENPEQNLYFDIDCPEGELILHLIQGDKDKSIDVSNLNETQTFSLASFEKGTINIVLEINGAKNVKSHIYIE